MSEKNENLIVAEPVEFEEEWIPQAEAARILKCSRQYIGQLIRHPDYSRLIKTNGTSVSKLDILNLRTVKKGKIRKAGRPEGSTKKKDVLVVEK